jgi:sugar/nucleoside kinase (ribokinase family)
MKSELEVLAIGELNVDLILNQLDGFPEIGKEKLAGSMNLTLGSSTAIFAANLSSLGVRVGFLGKIGNDSFGRQVIDNLKEKNIDTSLVKIEDNIPTGATVVLNCDEDRAMITFPGAMNYLSINDISDDSLLKAQHIHFSSFFIQPGIRNDINLLFSRAKKLGLTTSLDLQWDPSEKWDFDYKNILPFVDVFLPNEAELLNITKAESLKNGIDAICPFSKNLIVKRGSKGALLHSSEGGTIEIPAYKNSVFVDAIGAGDSFNAGFILKFVKGESLTNCLDFGNLIGALNTTASGGTGAFISKDQIMKDVKNKFNITIRL